jgi:glycosyltransferase involved in cell wall biosynthesis
VLLLGRGGPAFREQLVARYPNLAKRLTAPGELPPECVAARIRSCDIVIQPYIDGISSRRGSAMTGLALARPVVSNLGPLSESLWERSGCVGLAARPDAHELAAKAEAILALSPQDREDLGRRAAELYRARFSVEHTLARLRTTDALDADPFSVRHARAFA